MKKLLIVLCQCMQGTNEIVTGRALTQESFKKDSCLKTFPLTGRSYLIGYAGSSRRHNEDNSDNESVKSEGLSEDHHQNERNQNILLSVGADTSITDNTDSKASGER